MIKKYEVSSILYLVFSIGSLKQVYSTKNLNQTWEKEMASSHRHATRIFIYTLECLQASEHVCMST